MTSICAIIPANLMQAANDSLEQQGFGAGNFSVPLYGSSGATYAGLHAWNDAPFVAAVKAITGVIWEESDGDPTTRFNALVESRSVKWAANATILPAFSIVKPGEIFRDGDKLWGVIQQFDRGVYNLPPETYPALIRQVREPGQVYEWKQPIDQYDAYKLLNPFTNQNDECMYQGKKWYVTQADGAGNNVWAPGVYGWSETDPTPNIFVRAWDWVKGLFTWK